MKRLSPKVVYVILDLWDSLFVLLSLFFKPLHRILFFIEHF